MAPFKYSRVPVYTGSHLPAPRAPARGTEVQQEGRGVPSSVPVHLRQGLPADARAAIGAAHLLQLLPQVRARMRVINTTTDFTTVWLSNKIRK